MDQVEQDYSIQCRTVDTFIQGTEDIQSFDVILLKR